MILVTGATGNVGAEVVRALVAADEPVRALVRAPRAVPRLDGVETVTGDLNRPESMTDARRGVRAMFLLPGYENLPELLAEARRTGVEQVVLLSGGSAGSGDLTNAVTRYMAASESAVRASGLARVLGRDLTFVGLTNEEARAELLATMPAEYVDAFFDFYVTGTLDESVVRPTVREVTGHDPRTFDQWAQTHLGTP
ncbi:SDR family oxidoreductase [Nonomuraea sp. NPDC050790]|uniref:SDR family oxidoreductase n=1 Tax=Nonomuraea sp. NPDC050790 TaxID=3364371 RepID=UPI0037A605C0